MRATVIVVVILVALAPGVLGQTAPRTSASQAPLEEFLKQQAFELLSKRRQEIAGIKTPEQIAARQECLRGFFLSSLGKFPERTPLNPRVIETRTCDGYRREKIIFESRPDHHVTAVLYLPESEPPYPGVLVPCGHSANGKAYEGYQRMCILLAKNGIAAFCFDPIGQGERVQKLDEKGKPAIKEGSTTEHTMAGIGAILVGRQAASYRVWDAIRALDYLASRPEVDPKRLGCTGNSGGGTETAFLMALDDRVAVAAPSCYITSLERLFATIGPQDAEQNITGQVAAGMDHADYVLMHAPKPTLLCVGTQDFFDIQGSWDTFREAKLLFGRLGYGERVDLFESDEPHGFTRPRREASARWFSRWLLRRDEPITEPAFPVASDRDLQCTRTGQVLSDLKGVSVFDLNAQRDEELKPGREAYSRTATSREFRTKVKELLGLAGRHPCAKPMVVKHTSRLPNGLIRELEVESEPGVSISAIEFVPDWPDDTRPVLIQLSDQPLGDAVGRLPGSGDNQGRRVVLTHVRGLNRPVDGKKKPSWTSEPDVNESFLSLHIDRPLLGQRTLDVLNLLESLSGGFTAEKFPGFELAASGPSAIAALHAAALDERGLIRALAVERTTVSWSDVVRSGVSRGQLASIVPGVLQFYDLPDLAARLEPLSLSIREPIDAVGRPVSLQEARSIYTCCINAYGEGGRLTLESGR